MAAVKVSYQVNGTGPALYMVHGIGSRKTAWAPIVHALQDRFTCVVLDLRGHGDSPVPPPPYTLDDLVEDVELLRQTLGHEELHIIGHALGGMIGPAYARAYPARVRSVGLLSTAAGRNDEDRDKLAAVRFAMGERGVMSVIGTLVERWYTDDFARRFPTRIEERKQQIETTPEAVFLTVFDIYATTEMAPWLHTLTCPCLILTGELDSGCNPRLNQLIHSEIPDSRLVILDGLKHSILVEAPDRVVPHLERFLALACLDEEDRL